jgi:hypothetical protein
MLFQKVKIPSKVYPAQLINIIKRLFSYFEKYYFLFITEVEVSSNEQGIQ